MRCAALLAVTEFTGGQSSRETVASQTPRTGCCGVIVGVVGFAGCAGRVTAGDGVTSDGGGAEEQLTSKQASAVSAARAVTPVAAFKGGRRVIVNSISG